jgi:hypothetical protein
VVSSQWIYRLHMNLTAGRRSSHAGNVRRFRKVCRPSRRSAKRLLDSMTFH